MEIIRHYGPPEHDLYLAYKRGKKLKREREKQELKDKGCTCVLTGQSGLWRDCKLHATITVCVCHGVEPKDRWEGPSDSLYLKPVCAIGGYDCQTITKKKFTTN